LDPRGGVGDLFCPLVHVDWGIFGQSVVARATGHLGFGVFTARQRSWRGDSLLRRGVALWPEQLMSGVPLHPGVCVLGGCFALSLMPIGGEIDGCGGPTKKTASGLGHKV
jgi:hypothetical protein